MAKPRKAKHPPRPLESLFHWGEDGRVIRNEELYRELLRAGFVLRPGPTVAKDREWTHADSHADRTEHGDWTEPHLDEVVHLDYEAIHLDDRGGEQQPGDSPVPPGGHGDATGSHLDRWIPHGDGPGHLDSPAKHHDGPEHYDYHSDRPYEGHWDVDHIDG